MVLGGGTDLQSGFYRIRIPIMQAMRLNDKDKALFLEAYSAGYRLGALGGGAEQRWEALEEVVNAAEEALRDKRPAKAAGCLIGALAGLGDDWPALLLEQWYIDQGQKAVMAAFVNVIRRALESNETVRILAANLRKEIIFTGRRKLIAKNKQNLFPALDKSVDELTALLLA